MNINTENILITEDLGCSDYINLLHIYWPSYQTTLVVNKSGTSSRFVIEKYVRFENISILYSDINNTIRIEDGLIFGESRGLAEYNLMQDRFFEHYETKRASMLNSPDWQLIKQVQLR
jgi:hypothetical protein